MIEPIDILNHVSKKKYSLDIDDTGVKLVRLNKPGQTNISKRMTKREMNVVLETLTNYAQSEKETRR